MGEKWDLEKDRAFKKKGISPEEARQHPDFQRRVGILMEQGMTEFSALKRVERQLRDESQIEKICINWWDAFDKRGLDPEVARLDIGLDLLKKIYEDAQGVGAFDRDFTITKRTSDSKSHNVLCIEGHLGVMRKLLFYVFCDISIPLMIGEEWTKKHW